jgi:hypothetical protein
MKPGTLTELGKLALNGALALFIAAIIQPILANSSKIDYGVILGGILGVTFLIGIGLMLLEKGGGNV